MNARDPGAPILPRRKEVVLLCGFLLCVAIAVATLVLPELSGGDAADDRAAPADDAASVP